MTVLDTTLRELEQAVPVQQPVFDPNIYHELRNQLEWLIRELQLPGASSQRTADLQYHYGLIQQQLVQYEQLRYNLHSLIYSYSNKDHEFCSVVVNRPFHACVFGLHC